MKIWVNLNVTFDTDFEDHGDAEKALRDLIGGIVAKRSCDTITFKTGEDTGAPFPGRKTYTSYNES